MIGVQGRLVTHGNKTVRPELPGTPGKAKYTQLFATFLGCTFETD